jgi:Tripartite tricarboxylate transporter TctB family
MQKLVNKSNRDYFGGALMIIIGAAAAIQGQSYQIGSLSRMGPGFFPVALGVILALAGTVIIITAWFSGHEGEDKDLPPEWRGWFCICASIVAFVVLGKYGGLLPASFAIVFISALGDRDNTIMGAGLLAAAVCVVCVVVFWWALQVQFPLFTWG